jgi:hypothetical protein
VRYFLYALSLCVIVISAIAGVICIFESQLATAGAALIAMVLSGILQILIEIAERLEKMSASGSMAQTLPTSESPSSNAAASAPAPR